MSDQSVAKITGQLFKIETRKDGGGRIQMDFGLDSLAEIQKIQNWNGRGGINFVMAIVPFKDGSTDEDFPVDEHGEIQI